MNVSLTPELEKLVTDKIESGMYQTASEVVLEALQLLQDRDRRKLSRLRRDIRAGFEQIEQGQYTEYDERTVKNLAKEVKARGRRRLAEQRKARAR